MAFEDCSFMCVTGDLIPWGLRWHWAGEEEFIIGSIDAPSWFPAGGCCSVEETPINDAGTQQMMVFREFEPY